MADQAQLCIDLAPEIADALRVAVAQGDFESMNDAVIEALEEWWLRRKALGPGTDALRALAREGIDSGPGLDADLVFGRLRAQYPVPQPD